MITAAITHGIRNTARRADRSPAETVWSARARPGPRAIEPTRGPVVDTAGMATTLGQDGARERRTVGICMPVHRISIIDVYFGMNGGKWATFAASASCAK